MFRKVVNWVRTQIHRAPKVDIEMAQPTRVFLNGFPAASELIASDIDRSASIYRCFHRLSARNLLYLEAELLRLEKEQDNLDIDDSHGGPDILQYLRSWEELNASQEQRQKVRVDLIQRISVKLKEYHEALFLQRNLLEMSKPHIRTVGAMKSLLHDHNSRHGPAFSGLSNQRLDDETDLVALHPEFSQDWLMRVAQLPYLRMLSWESNIDNSIARFSKQKLSRVVGTLSLMIAGVLFIGAIVALYFIKNDGIRLGLICVFMSAFAFSLHSLTNAKRIEIFASTAAYAAVLVVFVSGNLGTST